jgi:ELWxxDGT repeat protein
MSRILLLVLFISSFSVQAQTTISLFKDLNNGGDGNPRSLSIANGMLFFSGESNGLGEELWMSNGTESGTQLLKDINPGNIGSSPTSFVTLPNGNVVFTAIDNANGYELWITDGTEAGTSLLADIYNGTTSSDPTELTMHNGSVFFRARDAANGVELWVSDGTTSGTSLVKNINPNLDGVPRSITSALNLLFFQATENGDVEPWISNGTTAGTVRLKDIATGAAISVPANFTLFNGEVYFSALDANGNVGLWKTNGTEAGTILVTNIGPNLGGGNRPSNFTVFDGNLYFFADDGSSGRQLWKSNGTSSGTASVTDLDNVGYGPLVAYQNVLFFPAMGINRNKEELWTYRPATDHLAIYVDISGGASGPQLTNPDQLTVFDDKLFFSAEVDGSGDRQLFVSDGVNFLVIERVAPGVSPETNNIPLGTRFIPYGNHLYLSANFNSAGMELWRIEGTNNVSVEDHETNGLTVKVYPQPAVNTVTINLEEEGNVTQYQVLSLNGKVVSSGAVNSSVTQVDVSNLATGNYILKLQSEEKAEYQRIITVNR